MKTVRDYAEILNAVRRIAPEAHIAGGAVRDTILGKSIRDVDVFLHEWHRTQVAAMLRSEFEYVKVGEWEQYELFSDPMIAGVARFEKASEKIPVCLIALKRPLDAQENMRRFDFGICMGAWDGSGEFITRPEFEEDRENQTFTLCRADNKEQFAYSMTRFEKLTADRYQGWTIAIPKKFEDLAKERVFRQHYYEDDLGAFVGKNVLRPKDRSALKVAA